MNTILALNQQEASFRKSEQGAGFRSLQTQEQLAIHQTASCEGGFRPQYLHGQNTSKYRTTAPGYERKDIEMITLGDRCQVCGGALQILFKFKDAFDIALLGG